MKKYLVFAAVATLVLTACQQETNPILEATETLPDNHLVFKATTESSATKTELSDNGSNFDVVWRAGDRITIVDGAATPNVAVYSTESTTTHADFTPYTSDEVDTPVYKAWYPANIYNAGTPTLPAIQTYVADNISGSPMYAESGNTSLAFKNICGIIRLNLSTTMIGKSVSSISLSANEGMSGAISNAATLADDSYIAAVSGTAGITLNCGAGIDISTTPTAFYFSVPAGTYTNFSITVTTTDGLSQTRTAASIVVGRSSMTNITLAFNSLLLAVDLTSSNDALTIPSGVNAKLFGSNASRVVNIAGGNSVVTLDGATMRNLTINGDATVVLTGTNATSGESYVIPIEIKEGNTATFRGDGTINMNAYYCTGVIACENNNANIVIESGTYNMDAGTGVNRVISAGGLTITGGTVNASTSGYASIYAEKDVVISGGEVNATGGAQGIYVYGGDLLISGGTVTARQTAGLSWGSGPEALVAGIVVNSKGGAGVEGGNLTISGGTVNAIGYIGPGIGSAWRRSGWSPASWTKSIVISGGTVTASTEESGFGAIHYNGFGNATRCDAITITSGITSLTLIQGETATRMFSTGDVSATFTVDGTDLTGYFANPASVDWTFDHIQRVVTTTTNENDTWTFTPKP